MDCEERSDKNKLTLKKRVALSKFLSYVLRHHPERIDLVPDKAGWVEVKALLINAGKYGNPLTYAELEEIVVSNDKKRFELNKERTHIRARQGHSISVDLGFTPIEPPEFLYHGTASRFISSIKEKGLIKGQRLYVHLSKEKGTAVKVGQRHGKPVVITILARRMYKDGYKFFLSSNGVWLTEKVPPAYLEFQAIT